MIGVLASAVSAFYYLRIVKVMYFDEPVTEFAAVPRELDVVMAATGFLVVTYFVTVGAPLDAARPQRGGKPVLVPGFWLGPKAPPRRLPARTGSTASARPAPRRSSAAAAGDVGDVWFAALQQTAGRGRRGRAWETPARQPRRDAC